MLELNARGHVKNRESQCLEFKQAFQMGDSLLGYARTIVAMANNQGGRIVFGVQDSPHLPIGLKNDRFSTCDPKNINRAILESFSADVEWTQTTFSQFGVEFGQLLVKEAAPKPIICTRNHDKAKLREGAIYFRYRAETMEIRHTELQKILDHERDKEKKLWMSHIQSIASIGPQSVQVVDTLRGELEVGGKKIFIDSDLLNKLKLIKEGHFDEKAGAPALKIVGEIEGIADCNTIYTESLYPHTQANFTSALPINAFEFQVLAWNFLKGNPRYHAEFSTGARSVVQKYTQKAMELIQMELRTDPAIVKKLKPDYLARSLPKDGKIK